MWKNWRDGKALDVIDPILRDRGDSTHDMIRCIHVALLCVQENAVDRLTMGSAVAMLSTPMTTLQEPSQPAFANKTGTEFSSADSRFSSSEFEESSLMASQNEASVIISTSQ